MYDISAEVVYTGRPLEDCGERRWQEAWSKDICSKFIEVPGPGEVFLNQFVPSQNAPPLDFEQHTQFKHWIDRSGDAALDISSAVDGLARLVAGFPHESRPAFFDVSGHSLEFPLPSLRHNHPPAEFDIAVTFPSTSTSIALAPPEWNDIACIVQVRATAAQDPFDNILQEGYNKALVQLSVAANHLMVAHGLLCAHTLGFYGDVVRIIRFDRAGAVYSAPLELSRPEVVNVVREFFWKLFHPIDPRARIVGGDPTVRRLHDGEWRWLKTRLATAGITLQDADRMVPRRISVLGAPDADEDDATPYFVFKPVAAPSNIFSRGTTVWHAVEHAPDEATLDQSKSPVVVNILKETWRLLECEAETDIYATLSKNASLSRHGIQTAVIGTDMGEWDVRRLEKHLKRCAETVPDNSRLADPKQLYFALDPALPYAPSHQTFTWRVAEQRLYWRIERSHLRFVMDTIGKAVTSFDSTREMTMAFYDALRGHRWAVDDCNVLHRDVSVNNIMIARMDIEKFKGGARSTGFLHDFDFASRVDYDPDHEPLYRKRTYTYSAVDLMPPDDPSRYFASPMHRVHHDLESFFWSLLHVVFRNTLHNVDDAPGVFEAMLETRRGKRAWLDAHAPAFEVAQNAPVTALLRAFAGLVAENVARAGGGGGGGAGRPLDHARVLAIFEGALGMDGWPVGDRSLAFERAADALRPRLPRGPQEAPPGVAPEDRTGARSVAHAKDDLGSDFDADDGDDEDDDDDEHEDEHDGMPDATPAASPSSSRAHPITPPDGGALRKTPKRAASFEEEDLGRASPAKKARLFIRAYDALVGAGDLDPGCARGYGSVEEDAEVEGMVAVPVPRRPLGEAESLFM
ncbi:uncharacterized protein BXZ73DRAFT_105055 [Epithele typhae]|uniref:uncharacterized protein n=1 Tax=Epithele typhae TaxID=378194 RepID=UPI0020073CE4|nr:uncharacterized protein BXZ73DRAFT_105055 [Epithele typhae]KAH9918899.1 hypothetical protein BXZ73DRAFT_105055 [Epithele typhae]